MLPPRVGQGARSVIGVFGVGGLGPFQGGGYGGAAQEHLEDRGAVGAAVVAGVAVDVAQGVGEGGESGDTGVAKGAGEVERTGLGASFGGGAVPPVSELLEGFGEGDLGELHDEGAFEGL